MWGVDRTRRATVRDTVVPHERSAADIDRDKRVDTALRLVERTFLAESLLEEDDRDQRVRRWVKDHCAECGRRFLWRDSRTGYMGSDEVFHYPCMSLRTVRGHLDDITGYLRGTADDNARWRVEYRLKQLEEAGTE